MSRQSSLQMMCATAPLGSLAAPPLSRFATPSKAKRPNVVILLTDDMGFSNIGCFGSESHTPNLDRLAQEGM